MDDVEQKYTAGFIFGQMAKGAAIAAAVFFGPVIFIMVIYQIGLLLPERSREAPDPTPDSFSYIIMDEQKVIAA